MKSQTAVTVIPATVPATSAVCWIAKCTVPPCAPSAPATVPVAPKPSMIASYSAWSATGADTI